MHKILRADKDTYITDRVIKGVRSHGANVGAAGSLDLFKLYGITSSGSYPNIELSRLLVHFDLDPLRDLVSDQRIDPNNASFSCTLKLFDVYGGQPNPNNFTVSVYPLSRSFDEGLGRDVVYYSDIDTCNFLTGSRAQGPWLLSGCNLSGGIPGTVDIITSSTSISSGLDLFTNQVFVAGEEDLEVDVTTVVSATLAGLLPDEGFRISFEQSLEDDQRTYFVKRFASRTAFNEDKRPRLTIRYDDSVQDDSQALFFDSSSSIFLYTYNRSTPANLTSGSLLTQITGSNCLILKLATAISGGHHNLIFTGSQYRNGINYVTGIYSASVYVPSNDSVINTALIESGSLKMVPIWGSLDDTVSFITGSAITIHPVQRGGSSLDPKRFIVSIVGIQDTYRSDEETVLRVNIFDHSSPLITVVKTPVELPGIVVRDVHWQIRDDSTGIIETPFDVDLNSTRVSSDASGMFFKLDTTNLTKNRTYVIDILIITGNNRQVYKAASSVFKVSDLR